MAAKKNPFVGITLTAERLRALISYNPMTGMFYRIEPASNIQSGPVSPRKSVNGYLRMRIDGKLYTLHRLAWLYMTGCFPEHGIDHIDGDRSNNIWLNLRGATALQNSQNIAAKSIALSGLRGAYPMASGRWQSKIKSAGKYFALGTFDSAIEAHQAYIAAKLKLHDFSPELRGN